MAPQLQPMAPPNIITNKTRLLEIAAVFLTAIGKFIFMDNLNWRFPFIATAIIGWSLYVIYRSKRSPGILAYWGFRKDNFKKTMLKVLPFGIITLVACIGIGIYRGTINLSWHIIPILILYPLWGIIQQFLLIALTAGNLQDIKGHQMNKVFIILVAAMLFAIVHYPYPWLMGATFALALFYGWIYLKERNIYVLGLFHGWLGAIFYYTILERDPFVEMFGPSF
jgi:membrane protease YdiL (CAAX protease family)